MRPDIDAIRARCEAATEGPWALRFSVEGGQEHDGEYVAYADWDILAGDPTDDDWVLHGQDDRELDQCRADAEFVTAARSDVPVLLDYIQRLEDALDAIAVGAIPPKSWGAFLLTQTAQEYARKTIAEASGGC